MDLNERLKKMEDELKRRTEAIDREARAKLDAVEQKITATEEAVAGRKADTPRGPQTIRPIHTPAPHDLRIDMSTARSLDVLDDIIEEDFELLRYLGGSLTAYPTVYCETVREYLEPIIADMPMSDAQREVLLNEVAEAAEHGAPIPILTSLGVHIPGVGCFINGWFMGQLAGVSPGAYFQAPEGFARIVTTASHEKWGHGFISELTALGREKQSVQLGMHHLADQFERRTVDTPDHARLREQWEILFYASNYVEEGCATWIERYLAERVTERDPRGPALLDHAPSFTVESVADALDGAGLGPLAEAVGSVFSDLSQPLAPERWFALAAALNESGEAFTHACGMPSPYVVGYLIMDRVAQRQGPKCVPYAVATACNVEYGLKDISNHDLRNYVENHPELNVNARMAAIVSLAEGPKDDIKAFLARVRDEIGFAPPA